MPAYQAQGPEFSPQHHQKKKKVDVFPQYYEKVCKYKCNKSDSFDK
jgi:hypothetical protein